MALREFVLNNFRWKLTSLLLAVLVWFLIRSAIYKETTGGRNQVLTQEPVLVLKAPGDPRVFRIVPPEVEVTVRAARELHPEDLEVFVDLRDLPDVPSKSKQVLVRSAQASQLSVIGVKPWGVTVEQVGDSASTNSTKRP
jgi:hypothetical protein